MPTILATQDHKVKTFLEFIEKIVDSTTYFDKNAKNDFFLFRG